MLHPSAILISPLYARSSARHQLRSDDTQQLMATRAAPVGAALFFCSFDGGVLVFEGWFGAAADFTTDLSA